MTKKIGERKRTSVVLASTDGKATQDFKNGPVPGGSDAANLYAIGELLKIKGREQAIIIAKKKLRNQLKLAGIKLKHVDNAVRNKDGDATLIEESYRSEIRLLRLIGLPVGTQTKLFENAETAPPPHPSLLTEIALEGYRAGMFDRPMKENPHIENPPLSNDWISGWHVGQADRKATQEDMRGLKSDEDKSELQ